MAGLALGAVGAYLAPAGYASLGWLIGSTVGNLLFPQSQPDVRNEGPRLGDLEVQSSDYGRALPKIYGTMPVGGNIAWSKKLREVVTTTTEEVGAKGGPSQSVTNVSYQYFAEFYLALTDCVDAPIVGISRLWINGELMVDNRPSADAATVSRSAEFMAKVRVYLGTATQGVDPMIEADKGVGNTPAYRHTSGLVFEGLEVTRWGTIPQIKVEVVAGGTKGPLITYWTGLATADSLQTNTVYIPDRGELWINDIGFGSGNDQDRLGIYNLASKTWEYVLYQSPWHVSVVNAGIYLYAVPEWDRMYVQGRALPSGLTYNTLIYSISTRQYLTSCYERVGGGFSSVLLGVDVANRRGLLFMFEAEIHLFTMEEGIPVTDLGFVPSSEIGDGRSFADAGGNIWSLYTDKLIRVYLSGAVVTRQDVPAGADGAFSSTFVLCYDPSRDCLYYWSNLGSSAGHLQKFDCATRTPSRLNSVSYATTGSFPTYGALLYAADVDRVISVQGGVGAPFDVIVINPTDGSIETTYSIPDGIGTNFGGGPAYAPGVVWAFASNGLGELRFSALSDTPPTLAAVVTDICARAGLSAGDIDVTQLVADTVAGYAVTRVGPARSALEPLMLAYQFDAVESEGKIKFVKRGGAVVATIGPGDLGAANDGDETQPPVQVTSRLETEIPREVRITYADAAADYADGVQYDRRQVGSSIEVQSIALPMRLTPAQAKRIASMVLYGSAAASEGLEFDSTNRWLHLEPTDVIAVNDGETQYTARAESKAESKNRVRWKGATEDIAVYTQAGAGVSAPSPVSAINATGNTLVHLLDLPILRPQDDNVGLYVAAAGLFTGWRGCELWKSNDGTNYSSTGLKITAATPMGHCSTALQNFTGGHNIDTLSHVTVRLVPGSGSLSSGTEQQFLDGERAALIGGELVLFRNASLVAADTYQISRFLRGRAGTETAMGGHVAGERFVLLSALSLKRIEMSAGEKGLTRHFKAVTTGRTVSGTVGQPFTFQNVGKKPLAPIDLAGGRDDSNNWITKWTRRSRLAHGWNDFVDTPIGEGSLAFDVEIWNSTFTTLKRTAFAVSVETYTYTAADQTTDFGGTQTTIYMRVHPLGTDYGRGDYVQGTLT